MIGIYILLGIIAVGVLLASESGQKLLFWITAVLIVVGLGYLSFWIIIFVINSEVVHKTFGYILGIFLIGIIWAILSYTATQLSGFIKRKIK